MTRYLTKVAISAIATYLVLTLATALFAPTDIHVAATTAPASTTPTNVLLRRPQTFHKQGQAPLNSFSTITVPATGTPSAPAVMETSAAIVTVTVTVTSTEYIKTPGPVPTSLTAFLEEYPYTATATLMGMTCFWIAGIWASLTFVMWCRIKIAVANENGRKEDAKKKLKLMDLEKAPDELENMMFEEAEAEVARNTHKVVAGMDLKQLIEELGRGT